MHIQEAKERAAKPLKPAPSESAIKQMAALRKQLEDAEEAAEKWKADCLKVQAEAKLKKGSKTIQETQEWDAVKEEMSDAMAAVKMELGTKDAQITEITRLKEERDDEIGALKSLLSERDDENMALNKALGMAEQQEKLAQDLCRSKDGEIEKVRLRNSKLVTQVSSRTKDDENIIFL